MNEDNTRVYPDCIRGSLRLVGQLSYEWIWVNIVYIVIWFPYVFLLKAFSSPPPPPCQILWDLIAKYQDLAKYKYLPPSPHIVYRFHGGRLIDERVHAGKET